MSTILLNYPFRLTLIFFFFSVLSPKIAYSAQLLSCFQGNESGAWHCGSLMQSIVRLAVFQDRESTAAWVFIKDSLTVPGASITLHLQPFIPNALSPSRKPNGNMKWILLSPFHREEKRRYKTSKCLYKGHVAPPRLDLNLQIWLPPGTFLLPLNLQTSADDSVFPVGRFYFSSYM